jgi:hypothetical protein
LQVPSFPDLGCHDLLAPIPAFPSRSPPGPALRSGCRSY